tara:strand:- start:224 stop:535 length:312 start_codon:yes stop_codon:yes gene_type:complete
MNNSELILKAVLSRIKSRLNKSVAKKVAEAANFAQETPINIKNEWEKFKDEILKEIEEMEINDTKELNNDKNKSHTKQSRNNMENQISIIKSSINDINVLLDD